MKKMGEFIIKHNWLSLCISIFLLLIPSVIWIFLDNHVWPWDQAWYGQVSVDLYYKLTSSFFDWGSSMFTAFGIKAPAIAWFGQFFVPLRGVLGSVDRALMVSVFLVQFLSLILVYRIVFLFSKGDKVLSFLGSVIVASGPLFIGMSHQYFVESFQLFIVTYFIFIMIRAKKWNRYNIILSLIFAFSYAMLVKITSPIYIFFPVLVICFRWFYLSNRLTLREFFSKRINVFLYSVSLLFLFAVCLWYITNWGSIYKFMQLASSGSAAELYGTRASFPEKFSLWLSFFQKSFFLPHVSFLVGILFMLAVLIRWKFIRFRFSYLVGDIFFVSFASITSVIILFSLQVNEETRYLLPLGVYVSIMICWFLYHVKARWLNYVILSLFFLQFAIIHAFTLEFFDINVSRISAWTIPIHKDKTQLSVITAILKETCNSESSGRINMVAVEFPHLNANSLEYYAAQRRLDSDLICYYTSLGYAENDQEKAWDRMVNNVRPPYFITIQKDSFGKADAFNRVSYPITERVEKSEYFTEVKTIHPESVRIFRSNFEKNP